MKCLQCKKEFETASVTAKFCSGNCRVTAFRNKRFKRETATNETGVSTKNETAKPVIKTYQEIGLIPRKLEYQEKEPIDPNFLGYDENGQEVDLRDVDYSHKEIPIYKGKYQWAKNFKGDDIIPAWFKAGYKSKSLALDSMDKGLSSVD